MNEAVLVVGAIRVLAALPVLRWPLGGALLAIAFDLGDLVLFNYLGLGWPPDYQSFDKVADAAYMLTFLAVALRWNDPERRVAVGLFSLRAVGAAVFVATAQRWTLALFPNVFELWFVFVAARDRFAPSLVITRRRALVIVLALLAAKLPQEYLLHIDRRLDQYALKDVVERLLR